MTFLTRFSDFVCEGDSIACEVAGFDIVARIERDDCTDAPDQRQDGFWPSLYKDAPGFIGPGPNHRKRFADAQAKAEAVMKAWHEGQWFYCGIVLSIALESVTLDPHATSLWGIEANFPGSDNAYLTEVAQELLPEALDAGHTAARRLRAALETSGARARRRAPNLKTHQSTRSQIMAQPILKTIPLSELRISKLNMRHSRKKPDVSDILPSIRESGIRQTLLVRKEGDHFGVVAGRRRFFALKEIEKETGKTPKVPCAIMREEDAASAIAASVIENVGRLPASEMEQYTAFKRLYDEGRNVDEIAAFFGVTELLVRRVLALASLSEPIRKLYAEDEIDRETIRALTLATEDQQAEWLRLYQSEDERAPRSRNCKAWITGGAIITTNKALFELESFDGDITTDLFGEHGVFADPDAFWKAQSAAVAQRIEACIADGWKDVICLERGVFFHRWDHQTRTKRQGGKVYVELRHDGTVTFHEGFVSQAEARRQEKAKAGDNNGPVVPVKPEMSGPLAEYILLHRHGAAQVSLAAQPAIALRLMVAHAMTGSALWQVRGHECRSRKADTRGSLEVSKAVLEMADKHARIASMFDALGVRGEARRNSDPYRLCETFAALLAMSDAEVMEVLAFTVAETLEAGGPLVEAVLHVCETDMSAYWKPDAAFFDLLRDKRTINAMVADIGSKSLAESCVGDTAKVQKQIIGNRITGEGCEANPDWRPGWMHCPPTRLVQNAYSPPAEAWGRIAGLFVERKETNATEAETIDQTDAA